MKQFGLAVAAVVVMGQSFAFAGETWYMKTGYTKNVVPTNGQFTDFTCWQDADGVEATSADIFSTENDFIVANAKTLRVSSMAKCKAKSLQVGIVGGQTGIFMHDSGSLDFTAIPDGVTFANGTWQMNTYSSGHDTFAKLWQLNMKGTFTVTSSAAAPFVFNGQQYAYRRDVFPALHGAEGTGIKLTASADKAKGLLYESFGFRDLSGYKGSIDVAKDTRAAATNDWTIGVEFGSTTVPGPVTLGGRNTAIRLLDKTNEVTLASLTMGDGAHIVVESDGKTNGLITVTDSYVQEGTVFLDIWSVTALPAGRIPVLRIPASVSVTEQDFVVSSVPHDASLENCLVLAEALSLQVVVVEDAESATKTVCVDVDTARAALTVDDSDNWTTRASPLASSMTNGTHWTDGTTDHTNKLSFTNGRRLRTPYSTKGVTFPGGDLVLNDESETHFHFNAKTFEIDYLYLTAPSVYFYVSNGTSGPELMGQRMYMSENTTLHVYNYTSSNLKFSPEIVGGGTIKTHGRSSTSSYTHYIELANLNTNWLGSVWLQADKGSSLPFPNYSMGFPRLYLSDGRNLGGRLPAFKYDALRLCHYARLYPRTAVTLEDGLNRGVCVDGAAVFDFEAGNDITIRQPLTVGGSIYKTGTGTLALGGEAKFLNYTDPYGAVTNTWRLYDFNGSNETVRTYGDVTVADMPDQKYADLSFLAVSNGYLKVAHVDAVNGLKVDFTPASKAKPGLKLDFNPADDDLRLYGVRNVKTDTPFVGTVNVTFDVVNAVDEDVQIMTNGIFTVKTGKYAETREQFKVTPPKAKGYRAKEVTFTSGENGEYTTFGYEYERQGLAILVR